MTKLAHIHCHYLRPNHGTYAPQSHIAVFLDTKSRALGGGTRKRYQAMCCGAAIFFRRQGAKFARFEEFTFWTREQFWTWAIRHHKPKRTIWLWAHRLGEVLTYLDFWELVDNGFYKLRKSKGVKGDTGDDRHALDEERDYLFCTMDPPVIVQAAHGSHLIHCVDVRNYFNEPMAAVAELAGKELLKRPAGDEVTLERADYCLSGARVIRSAVVKLCDWWTRNDLGVFRYTASALAFAAYRHRFMMTEPMIDDHKESRELSRLALCTGEARLWFAGHVKTELEVMAAARRQKKKAPLPLRAGPVYIVDCNSCYPHVMRTNIFPRALAAYKPSATLDDLGAWLPHLAMVARVRLDTPERPYPVVVNGERWYCVGKFWTALAGPELQAAFLDGAIVEVGQIAAYYPSRLFTRFVDGLYPMKVQAKRDGDGATYRFVKLLLDALPGKFAQRNTGWEWSDYPLPGKRWGTFRKERDYDGVSRLYRCIAGYVQRSGDKMDSFDSLPAVAAFVNAYARVYMREVRAKIREEYVLYQDTDSLHLTETGWQRAQALGLIDDYELGKFHLEHTAERMEYRGPKDYVCDGVHVYAGQKPDAEVSADGTFTQDELAGLDTILGRKPEGVILIDNVTRERGGIHPRGIVHADGAVTPAYLHGNSLSLLPPGERARQADRPRKRK